MDMAVAAVTSLGLCPFFIPPPRPSRRLGIRFISCSSSRERHPSSPAEQTLRRIQSSGVIACLRANSPEVARKAAEAAIRGGISVLEIIMSTPGVFKVLEDLVQNHPSMILGVGTVLTGEDAKGATTSGAKFLMSPAIGKNIFEDIVGDEVLYIPGAMTPTEILSAYEAGAKVVKVYPVSALGGIQYISALKKPFPHIPMVASQGITIDSMMDYISKGAEAVVLSDAIFDRRAMDQNNFNTIYSLACTATSKSREAIELKRRVSTNHSLHL